MLKKIFIAAVFSVAALCAFAQKSVNTAITDIEEDPTNGLEMTRCLFNEYYLAELTTHAKVTVTDSATVQKKTAALNADNKVLGSCKGVMKGIGEAGKLSALLAAESAPLVRSADASAAPAGKAAAKKSAVKKAAAKK